MTDGTCVTFLENVCTRASSFYGGGGSVATYLPHFVLLGRSCIEDDYELESIIFSVDDAEIIFYDFDAFSIALDPNPEVTAIIAKQAARVGRTIAVGKHPIVAYFTGKSDILSATTALGNISVNHRPRWDLGSRGGVSIYNKIAIRLDFERPARIEGAIDRLMPLLRFFQVIAGRKQAINGLSVKLKGADETTWHELVWCLPWSRESEGPNPQPADLPINGGVEPAMFASVLEAWLCVEEKYRDARVRFAESFSQQRRYGIDRLVSAANMFDILPLDCFEKSIKLPSDVAKARTKARRLFKELPPSEFRDRALGDLGRLGQQNLKDKIQQRACKLLAAAPGRYPELDRVINNAVEARNHYVHGTCVSAVKSDFFREMLPFHVDALEFVFATADLIDSGWDYDKWAKRGTTMSHPFGEFLASYKTRVTDYISLLN